MEELWVDGRPAASLTRFGWGELKWSHAADGGCKEATWRMDFPPDFSHPSFVRGKPVEVRLGPLALWAGNLVEPEPDDSGWSFAAVGPYTLAASGYLAFDGSLNVSYTPDVAIDAAIARGLAWTRPASLSAVAYQSTTTTDDLLYLGALLDQWADSAGKRWGVDANRRVYAAADPTVPTWHLVPGTERFGVADDDYASHIFLRYIAAGGANATTSVADTDAANQFGRREYGVDLTPMGILTAGGAQTVGNGLLAKGKARQGYTTGVEVSPYQLTSPGGVPAPLALVKAQQVVRRFGAIDTEGQPLPYVDWVIGETSYEAGASTIALTPVGLVARDLGTALSIIQEAS